MYYKIFRNDPCYNIYFIDLDSFPTLTACQMLAANPPHTKAIPMIITTMELPLIYFASLVDSVSSIVSVLRFHLRNDKMIAIMITAIGIDHPPYNINESG